MKKSLSCSGKFLALFLVLFNAPAAAQNLKLSDFAVWGGGAAASPYNSAQGVFITSNATIRGNIGSHHRIDIRNGAVLNGNVYSSNTVTFGNNTTITGNVAASRIGTNTTPALGGGNNSNITGDLTANGRIALGTGRVTGKVSVPAPTNSNYSGPAPSGGVQTNVSLPVLPLMPNNMPFDNEVGTATITGTQTISPGRFRKLALSGNRTLTFNGPGTYIFYEVDNGNASNKIILDFKNTTAGSINIFIIKDARWGTITASTVNGNFYSRVYTEVHGNGASLGGNAFTLRGPGLMPAGSHLWLGNVWAPNGGILVENTGNSPNPHIIGALWSGKSVTLNDNVNLQYAAPVSTPNYISPYYAPPPSGKVNIENNVIGAELFALSNNPAPITSIQQNEIFRFNNLGHVMIEVVSKIANDNQLKSELIAMGMTGIVDNGPAIFVTSGYFPAGSLQQLNSNSRIQYVRPLYPPIANRGQVESQGDSTMRSNNVRSRFGVEGAGVKVGVISDSYNSKSGAQDDVDQGDLPGPKSSAALPPNENAEPVQAANPDLIAGSDEGRAMLQIVHDVAPKAKLAFRTGFLTAGHFAKGIQELASPDLPGGKCDIIVDDITYITEPFLRDGIVAQTVNQVVRDGVTYFSSAGNFGQQSHEDVFRGVTDAAIVAGQIHRFGNAAGDIYQSVTLKPGSYTIVLQWSDDFRSLGTNGVQTDMDLYLAGANGYTLFGFNRSNLFGDPFEVCPFTVTEETNAKLMVVRAAGTGNVRFKYIIFRGGPTLVDYNTGTASIVGHPNADSAIAVGAMLYTNIPSLTPVWPGVASFSSRGGTFTQSTTTFAQRSKPDIIGPNGVNTTVPLGGAPFDDGDAYPNFFGTSAAAPHLAALGALLIEGRKKFNLQTSVTPYEVRQQMVTSAGRFTYLPGTFSYEGGYGFAQADSAMGQIANARPMIGSLQPLVPGAESGTQPFQVQITGSYLTPATQVYFNGRPVATTISADRTSATATIDPIVNGQDPPFQLYNPPKSPSKLDGGLSEALHLFSSIVDVTIRAANKSRKYRQENPVFTAEILYNGVLVTHPDTLAKLKLDGDNLSFLTIATAKSNSGLYGIFPSRRTPLAPDDPLLARYGFTFVSGTLSVDKMPVRITPNPKTLTYGEDIGEITYNYELDPSVPPNPTLSEEIRGLHKKFLADNALVVLHGFNDPANGLSASDLSNMSMMASFQAVRNARKFVLQDGRLVPLVNNLATAQIGNQRFLVDASAASLQRYKLDSVRAPLLAPFEGAHQRGFVNIKALARGNARVTLNGGAQTPVVNGQLMAMVNGQLQAMVNGQLQALVNGVYVDAEDIVFQNGQLLALVNGVWTAVTNGQLQAFVNGESVTVELAEINGQLQAMVNGQLMALVNGQLQALVNGQLLAIVNGQLQAIVNGQLMPLVNGQLVAMVNGQLQPMVNGQLLAMVNGQLMALVNGELQIVTDLTLSNGQLQALVNGQLQAIVNGQLQAMVNGVVVDIDTDDIVEVNGQLQAMVNGQLQAFVNGQLQALVNGQLQPLVNGGAVPVDSVVQLPNGQLQAFVNTVAIPLVNGQLQALVNGQLLAMVNGQLMAIVNGEVTFAVFSNGQLQAMVNGQLQPMVNGQLLAMVNGQLQQVNSYSVVNGQLQAIVNGETWVYANGQLLAMVNGQLQALVNNFDVGGNSNNSKTLVLVDSDDVTLQAGSIGGMFSINMITSLDTGVQKLVPGAFIDLNYEVSYGTCDINIQPALLTVKADSVTKVFGSANPDFTLSYYGFAYDDNASDIMQPVAATAAGTETGVGNYNILLRGGTARNYVLRVLNGNIAITKKALLVRADDLRKAAGAANPPLTLTFDGLVGDDTKDSVCIPYVVPPSPAPIKQLNRLTTYTNVKLNGDANFINATPGQTITLTGNYTSVYDDPTNQCPGCLTQLYVGMLGPLRTGVVFSDCYNVNFTGTYTGVLNRTFTAPTVPGVYYITQVSSWEYKCYDRGTGTPSNAAADAIAVVAVNISDESITASTPADGLSLAGVYPITLQGCYSYNPNYEVTLQDGTLTVLGALPGGANVMAGAEAELPARQVTVDRIYPNPVSTQLRVELQEDVSGIRDLEVFDELGSTRSVAIRQVSARAFDISVSVLPKGFYYLKVKGSKGFKTFKFIKM